MHLRCVHKKTTVVSKIRVHVDNSLVTLAGGITVLSTVGFGDITPQTWQEKMFSIVAELIGCVIFAMMIGGLSGIFALSNLDQKIDNQLDEVRVWAKTEKGMNPKQVAAIVQAAEPLVRQEVTTMIEGQTTKLLKVAKYQAKGTRSTPSTAAVKALEAIREHEHEKARKHEIQKLESVLEAQRLRISFARPIVEKWWSTDKDESGKMTLYQAVKEDGDPHTKDEDGNITFRDTRTQQDLRALGMQKKNARILVRHIFKVVQHKDDESTHNQPSNEVQSIADQSHSEGLIEDKLQKLTEKVDKLTKLVETFLHQSAEGCFY